MAERRPASAHPLCRFVLSALDMASEGFSTAGISECVRSGFMPVSEEEGDALIAYAESMDVRGNAWKRPFQYAKEGHAEELPALNASRESVVHPLDALCRTLSRAQSADDTVAAVIASALKAVVLVAPLAAAVITLVAEAASCRFAAIFLLKCIFRSLLAVETACAALLLEGSDKLAMAVFLLGVLAT